MNNYIMLTLPDTEGYFYFFCTVYEGKFEMQKIIKRKLKVW